MSSLNSGSSLTESLFANSLRSSSSQPPGLLNSNKYSHLFGSEIFKISFSGPQKSLI